MCGRKMAGTARPAIQEMHVAKRKMQNSKLYPKFITNNDEILYSDRMKKGTCWYKGTSI
jgi:hypothetical protein